MHPTGKRSNAAQNAHLLINTYTRRPIRNQDNVSTTPAGTPPPQRHAQVAPAGPPDTGGQTSALAGPVLYGKLQAFVPPDGIRIKRKTNPSQQDPDEDHDMKGKDIPTIFKRPRDKNDNPSRVPPALDTPRFAPIPPGLFYFDGINIFPHGGDLVTMNSGGTSTLIGPTLPSATVQEIQDTHTPSGSALQIEDFTDQGEGSDHQGQRKAKARRKRARRDEGVDGDTESGGEDETREYSKMVAALRGGGRRSSSGTPAGRSVRTEFNANTPGRADVLRTPGPVETPPTAVGPTPRASSSTIPLGAQTSSATVRATPGLDEDESMDDEEVEASLEKGKGPATLWDVEDDEDESLHPTTPANTHPDDAPMPASSSSDPSQFGGAPSSVPPFSNAQQFGGVHPTMPTPPGFTTFATQSEVADIRYSLRTLNNGVGRLITLVGEQTRFFSTMQARGFGAQPPPTTTPAPGSSRTGARSVDQASVDKLRRRLARDPRPTQLPGSRDTEHNALLADIRKVTRELMGRKKKGPFLAAHIASDNEVEAFDPVKGPACTVDAFRPDLAATPGTDWNVSVIHVFTQHYCTKNPNVDEELVTSIFKDHLKYLCNRYKESLDGEAAILRRQKRANRAERQRNLWQRRLAVCAVFPELREHLLILQDLGPFGMSSDESDDGSTGRVRYRIVRKLWRNDNVTAFLRILDKLYVIARIASRSGSQPHERVESNLKSTRRLPVCGLPQNAYNDKWFGLLTDYDRLLLKPKMGVRYKFSHPPRIIALAMGRSSSSL